MRTLGLVIFAVFGLMFMGMVIYGIADKNATGVLFRQKKLIPLTLGTGILGLVGFWIVYLNQ